MTHKPQGARVALVYKDFTKLKKGISHVGLGVTAENIACVLRQHGVHAEAWGVTTSEEVEERIRKEGPTHVVIGAFWIPTKTLGRICLENPHVQFAAVCHSNVGFLQTEPAAITLLYEAVALEGEVKNFHVAGNSSPFAHFVQKAFKARCLWLPNLYDLTSMNPATKARWDGKTLRVGCFGSLRSQKNVVTAAGAALVAAATLGAKGEFWVSTGRDDGGDKNVVLNAVKAMLPASGRVKLVENGWQDWKGFRSTVRRMDVLLQPSYTESWNVVTADGIAEGIPSVVSTAIRWAPKKWQADSDDACDVAKRAVSFVQDPDEAVYEGRRALVEFVNEGVSLWRDWLAAK